MPSIRPAKASDLEAFYAISLATGHLGGDASHLYLDPNMMGHIYSAPYLKFSPQLCFVAEDDIGIGGFIVGALDTHRFEDRLEQEWWPRLRPQYADPDEINRDAWNADQRRSHMIHHPQRTPDNVVMDFPSHLHMNLFPRLHGRGVGSTLLEVWLKNAAEQGALGVHVGTNANNPRASNFWKRRGFNPLSPLPHMPTCRTTWLCRRIAT